MAISARIQAGGSGKRAWKRRGGRGAEELGRRRWRFWCVDGVGGKSGLVVVHAAYLTIVDSSRI